MTNPLFTSAFPNVLSWEVAADCRSLESTKLSSSYVDQSRIQKRSLSNVRLGNNNPSLPNPNRSSQCGDHNDSHRYHHAQSVFHDDKSKVGDGSLRFLAHLFARRLFRQIHSYSRNQGCARGP